MTALSMADRDVARFWSKVSLPDANGCMQWLSGKLPEGYGRFWLSGGNVGAHRVSLELSGTTAPDGAQAAHAPGVCHNPSCVAPDHLRWATSAENLADRDLDGTMARGERHGMAKLSSEQVSELRRLHATGDFTLTHLGRRFGVSRVHAGRIVAGKKRSQG
jgi:hypothetical protein